MLNILTITDHDQWNTALRTLPYAHVLQSWEWGEFKRVTTGWQPMRLAFQRNGKIVAMASVGARTSTAIRRRRVFAYLLYPLPGLSLRRE